MFGKDVVVSTKKATILAGGFLLVAVGLLVWQLTDGSSLDSNDDPLSGLTYEKTAPKADREVATVAISRKSRAVAVPELRRIAREDPDPIVRSAAIAGLGEHRDYKSMDLILDGLESGSHAERVRATAAAARILGPRRVDPQTDSPEQRQRIIAEAYRRMWQALKGSPRLEEFQKKIDRTYGELP